MVHPVTYLLIIANADAVWKQLENEINSFIYLFIYFISFYFGSSSVLTYSGVFNKREREMFQTFYFYYHLA